jgi:hypothetical protein
LLNARELNCRLDLLTQETLVCGPRDQRFFGEADVFRRGGFGLTPPRFITFVVSLILVLAGVASLYTRLPVVGAFVNSHRLWIAVAGYVILMLGVLLRGL